MHGSTNQLAGSNSDSKTKLNKVSNSSNQNLDSERNKQKRSLKPWDERRSATVGSKIRTKLPGVKSYDKELEYHAEASPRVLLRLERIIGSDKVRINNSKYMTNLSKKIEEDERKCWKRRVNSRQLIEKNRYRQLIIDGILEPDDSTSMEEDLKSHPIFRVNRLMKKLNQFQFDIISPSKLPKITPIEPFEEQKTTGFLFGFHKNHYLRPMSSSRLNVKTVVSSVSEDIGSPYMFIAQDPLMGINEGEEEKMEHENEEREGAEGEEDETNNSNFTKTENLTELLRRESITQAHKYLELDQSILKKEWEIPYKNIVQNIFDPDKEVGSIYDDSKKILDTYKREILKTDDFCNKIHRKLFH